MALELEADGPPTQGPQAGLAAGKDAWVLNPEVIGDMPIWRQIPKSMWSFDANLAPVTKAMDR
ncbi:MAG: hypothetical protein GEU71_05465 [Actinobacteria bacterium]|nr:hypothetical protein [Actinomycetota bacterium]